MSNHTWKASLAVQFLYSYLLNLFYASLQTWVTLSLILQVAHEFNNSIYGKKPQNFKVIVSSHNFHNTPSTEAIGNLVARIQASGADIVKIATTALDITDVARVLQVTVHSQVSNVHHI